MFNCDHCQKKYKRSWHQARHSQMKHENSNASTATTSSAGTPPTPEINGNIPNNSNYNYQQLQQVPQMPSQPPAQEMNQGVAPQQQHQHLHQQNVAIPPANNNWNHIENPQQLQQQQHQVIYAAANDDVDSKNYIAPAMPPQQAAPVGSVSNSDYVNYAVNEQYSNKFEQVQTTPAGVTSAPNPTSYDSWVSYFYYLYESYSYFIICFVLEFSTSRFLGLQSTSYAADVSSATSAAS